MDLLLHVNAQISVFRFWTRFSRHSVPGYLSQCSDYATG